MIPQANEGKLQLLNLWMKTKPRVSPSLLNTLRKVGEEVQGGEGLDFGW
jgi:hypothetical protein